MFCPRCGAALHVAENEEGAVVCPACGEAHYRQLKVGAGLLLEHDGRLLLARRGPADAFPGTWNLPAGYCRPGEPPQETAAREAAEETGLEVRAGKLVDIYFFDDDPRGDGLLIVYEGTVAGGELRVDGEESVALGFFEADDLPAPLCGGGHDRAIAGWAARHHDRWQPGSLPRFCPHCTHPLVERVAFGRQRLVCLACGFIHFREPKVGVSVLIEREGHLLLVRRAIAPGEGQWSLPSGFVDWDEAPETAARRECLEETGLAVHRLDLVAVGHYSADFRGPGINLTYRAEVDRGEPRPGDDAGAVRFFGRHDLPPAAEIAFASHALAVERWRESHE